MTNNKRISEGLLTGPPRPKFTKFDCQISSCSDKKTVRDTAVENLCSGKSGPKFTKIAQDLLRTTAGHRAILHRARPNGVREKRYDFLHHHLAGAPHGDPLDQSSPIWVVMYSKAPSTNLTHFVLF